MTERVRADGAARTQTENGQTNNGVSRPGQEFVAFTLGAGTVTCRPFNARADRMNAAVLENLALWRSRVVAVFQGALRPVLEYEPAEQQAEEHQALTVLAFDLAGERAVYRHFNRMTRASAELELITEFCAGQLVPVAVFKGWHRPTLLWQDLMNAAIGADDLDEVARRLEVRHQLKAS